MSANRANSDEVDSYVPTTYQGTIHNMPELLKPTDKAIVFFLIR